MSSSLMICLCVCALCCPLFGVGVVAEPTFQSWAEAAHNFIRDINCSQTALITFVEECKTIVNLPRSAIAVYLAPPDPQGKYKVVLPERSWSRLGTHTSVLVLDPYPSRLFGHVIILFYLDRGLTADECFEKRGLMLEHNYCLYLAMKRRCRTNYNPGVHHSNMHRFCEIHFLPMVTLMGPFIQPTRQHLVCRDDITEFAPCPSRRTTTDIVMPQRRCNRLETNSVSCPAHLPYSTPPIPSPCARILYRCDQAVLVAGGWRPEADAARAEENVRMVYHRLRQLGFQISNMHSFVTDGQIPIGSNLPNNFHPAAATKVSMRNHIQTICSDTYCSNNLFLYLNNPTRLDGTMLLWDSNHDGQVTSDERYSVNELLSDLSMCQARRVIMIVEQNFAGDLKRALEAQRHNFGNTVLLASTNEYELTSGGNFTETLLRQNLETVCLQTMASHLRRLPLTSPVGTFFGHLVGAETLFGTTCDLLAMEDNLAGCRSLPTTLFIKRMASRNSQSIDQL